MSVTENKTPLKPEVNLEKKEDASQPTVELSQDKVSQSQAKQEIKSEVSDEQKGGLNEAMDTGDTGILTQYLLKITNQHITHGNCFMNHSSQILKRCKVI